MTEAKKPNPQPQKPRPVAAPTRAAKQLRALKPVDWLLIIGLGLTICFFIWLAGYLGFYLYGTANSIKFWLPALPAVSLGGLIGFWYCQFRRIPQPPVEYEYVVTKE